MKALGISGSARKNGNTAFSVKYALEQLKVKKIDTEYFSLSQMNILNCKSCWKCSENSDCFQKDDMKYLYEAFRKADIIILGSPVYFGMVSGLMKNMMDRCVVFRPSYEMPLELEGKTGCGIACGGFRNGGQETTLQNIHTFLLQQNMKVINDGFPYSHAGATIVDEAANDVIGLKTIDNLVNNIIKMVQ
ncbi:MAG: flavodoxin family protein [Spirochaetes bacterium]|jgi:multimeric flavodoxin WrbA|nr:flavodoxin family protein [Spirochaetota bacterium]